MIEPSGLTASSIFLLSIARNRDDQGIFITFLLPESLCDVIAGRSPEGQGRARSIGSGKHVRFRWLRHREGRSLAHRRLIYSGSRSHGGHATPTRRVSEATQPESSLTLRASMDCGQPESKSLYVRTSLRHADCIFKVDDQRQFESGCFSQARHVISSYRIQISS